MGAEIIVWDDNLSVQTGICVKYSNVIMIWKYLYVPTRAKQGMSVIIVSSLIVYAVNELYIGHNIRIRV